MTTTTPAHSQELHDLLKDLHTAASPAPWTVDPNDNQRYLDADGNEVIDPYAAHIFEIDTETSVQARNALPALLAEIERLQERERILGARLARVNEIAPVTYQLALSAGQGVGA